MSSMKNDKKNLPAERAEELLALLKARFEKNMNRHTGLEWANVQAKLETQPEKLWSLDEMEITGGEPDVVARDENTGEYFFYDCSVESPKDAEAFVMTTPRWNRERSINRKIARLAWLPIWASRY
jgi:hypothetical protein